MMIRFTTTRSSWFSGTATALVLAVLCVAAQLAAAHSPRGHDCAHDSPSLQEEQRKLFSASPAAQQYSSTPSADPQRRLFQAQAAQSIRIVFSYLGLTTQGKYCSQVGDIVPDYMATGARQNCTSTDDILTDAKRDVLENKILAAALARIQQVVAVEPISGNLVVPAITTCGKDFMIPPTHTITGVPSADLVVYVSSAPISGATAAFAGGCSTDQHGRTIVGRMNYDPSRLVWGNDTEANQELVDIAVHELHHVLGIGATTFMVPGRFITAQKRGKTVTMVTTPTVVAIARQFTGCDTLEGVEVEDEGTSGSAGSHWERKLYYDELMCAVVGNKLSGISLGFLNDLNVGYTINFGGADLMSWGKHTGCGVHDNKCNTVAGGANEYFCFDPPGGPTINRCTFDLESIGTCSVTINSAPLPTYFQYFSDSRYGGPPYMDGCPIVVEYANRQCSVPAPSSSNDVVFGYTYSNIGRCFNSTGLIQSGFISSNIDGPRCFEAQCTSSTTVQFRIDGSQWITCPSQGAVVNAPSGFRGSVICPDPAVMCDSLGTIVNTSTTPAPTPSPPAATTMTSTPAPLNPGAVESTEVATPSPFQPVSSEMTVVVGDLTIPGTAFAQIQANAAAWASLRVAVRLDVATLLSLDSSQVTIVQMTIGSLKVNFTAIVPYSVALSTVSRIQSFPDAFNPLPQTTAMYKQQVATSGALTIASAHAEAGAMSPSAAPQTLFAVAVGLLLVVATMWT